MSSSQNVYHQLCRAIDVSEKIITSLHNGELEKAGEYDGMRAECIRALSKCRNFETVATAYTNQIEKLSQLDNAILRLSETLRDEVLTEIRQQQTNQIRHVQYAENQLL